MTGPNLPITSTKQLIPDGVWGYRKAIGAFVTAMIVLVADAWADGSITPAEWKTIALGAVPAAIAAWGLANAIKPTPPAPVLPNDDDAPVVGV